MSATSVSAKNGRGMSQEEIAEFVGYKYLRENLIRRTLQQAQEDFIMSARAGRPIKRCGCSTKTSKIHCRDQTCINYKTNIICDDRNCGSGDKCANRPFSRPEQFVINQRKIVVRKQDGKGNCLYADDKIPVQALIGAYTGRVVAPGEKVPPGHENYVFSLGPSELGQGIDPRTSAGGSALQLINHSCSANCEQRCVIYKNSYQLIFQAKKNIKKGDELTIDYKWKKMLNKRDMECLCKSRGCNKKIQQEVDPLSDEEPSFYGSCGSRVLDLALEAVPLHQRPQVYYETHQFFEVDHTFTILCSDGQLRVAGANVIRTYTNGHQITILVVVSDAIEKKELHLPSLICFHYMEDAVFYLREGLSANDKMALQKFFKFDPDAECAKMLKNNVAIEYENQRSSDQLPLVDKARNTIQGPFGVGMANYVLQRKPEPAANQCQPNNDDQVNRAGPSRASRREGAAVLEPPRPTANYESNNDLEQPSTSSDLMSVLSTAMSDYMKAFMELEFFSKPCGDDDHHDDESNQASDNGSSNKNNPVAAKQRKKEEEEEFGKQLIEMPFTLPLVKKTRDYKPREREPIESVKHIYGNSVFLREAINWTCKELTLYAVSREHTKKIFANDRTLQKTFREILEWNYLDAESSERQFLTFEHYLMAIETQAVGSINCGFCSLCKKNFTTSQEHVDHFHSHHKLIAEKYTCRKCGLCEVLPSVFMRHVETCDEDMFLQIRIDVKPHIQDAFVDFLQSINMAASDQEADRYTYCLVLPGVPVLDAELNEESYGENVVVTLEKGRITSHCGENDVDIKIASNCKLLADWPLHPDARRPSSAPNYIHPTSEARCGGSSGKAGSSFSSVERRGKKRSKDQQQSKTRLGRVRAQMAPTSSYAVAADKRRRVEDQEEDDQEDEESGQEEGEQDQEDENKENEERNEENDKRPQTRSVTRKRRDYQGKGQ